MNPERVFQILTAIGLISGGWLYGDYWKKSERNANKADGLPELRAENAELAQQIDSLEGELAEVRSMLANGPYPIPDELIAWIEKDYDMVFLKAPNVRLASPTAIRDAAQGNLRLIHGEMGLEREGLAWDLLGLLPPNQQLFNQLLFVNSSGLKGVFDMTKEQILLSEDFDPVSVPHRSVLVRLLGQQLSFQSYPQKTWQTRDEWQAWEAVHTGSAAALQSRFLRRNGAVNETEWIDPEPAREQLLNDLEPALQGFCNFPYLEGADYSRFFYVDSRAAWAKMFRDPATTTAEILHPNREAREAKEIVFPVGKTKLSKEDQLGELGLRLWLEPFIGIEEAEVLATEWYADRYQLYAEKNGLFSLNWKIEMTDEKAARSLAAAIDRSLLRHFRETQVQRVVGVSHTGRNVIFTSTPKQ